MLTDGECQPPALPGYAYEPGAIFIQLIVSGVVWFFILGYFLGDQNLDFWRVVLWYAAAYAAGELLVLLKAMGVLSWPNDLILIVAIFIKTLVITLLMKL